MLAGEHQGVKYYLFPGLTALPGVRHGVFTRRGGVSQGAFATLNISFGVGDDPRAVRENRRRLAAALGLAALRSARQVHGCDAAVVEGPLLPGQPPETADILLTARPGLGLLIAAADCQAVLLYDPRRRVVANVHCGWRNQVHNVLGRAVGLLRTGFGCTPEDLHAAIGPGLGPCCAEFVHYRREFPREFWDYQVHPGYFDLWRLSADQLAAAGVPPGHIECARLCTRCLPGDFYSYRRDRLTGRHGTVIALSGDPER
jgi:YfiH family protein